MQQEIKNIIKDIKKAQIAKSLIAELRKEKKICQSKLVRLTKEIKALNSSINLLTNFSVEYIFKQIQGKRIIELEIKKEHYLNLSLEYNELRQTLDLLDYEISVLKPKAKDIRAKKEEIKLMLLSSTSNITDGNLHLYKKTLKELRAKLEMVHELDEAIIQGVTVNKHLNKTLRYLESLKVVLKGFKPNKSAYNNYRIDKLDKYQSYITKLHVEFVKFNKEYNDVHQLFFITISETENLTKNFLKQIRKNLLSDVRGNYGLKHSIQIVSNLKSNIMSLTRSLRSDVRKIEKEIDALEKKEKEILSNIF